MPGVVNGSFETAGASVGTAASWTTIVVVTGGVVAEFSGGSGAATSTEDFDSGWGTDSYGVDADAGTTTPAIFDTDTVPTDVESFDDWNGGTPYGFEVNGGVVAEFTTNLGFDVYDGDDFDHGWSVETYELEDMTFSTTFDEDFDSGWGTDAYEENVDDGASDPALFDGTEEVEDFENACPDLLFVVDESTDTGTVLSMPSFGPPPNGFPVTVVTTGAYPSGLVENQVYYLRDVATYLTGFTFKLEKTLGGSAVNITDAGIGSHYLHADPVIYWTRFEEP